MEPREKAATLPEKPGVYLFKDAGGEVLYVGKAASLRSRVRSYFLESNWGNAKTGRWPVKSPTSKPSSSETNEKPCALSTI